MAARCVAEFVRKNSAQNRLLRLAVREPHRARRERSFCGTTTLCSEAREPGSIKTFRATERKYNRNEQEQVKQKPCTHALCKLLHNPQLAASLTFFPQSSSFRWSVSRCGGTRPRMMFFDLGRTDDAHRNFSSSIWRNETGGCGGRGAAARGNGESQEKMGDWAMHTQQ